MKKRIEKHMGCLVGFFPVFDLHMLFARKRVCSTKRLSSSSGSDSIFGSVKSEESPKVEQKEKSEVRNSTGTVSEFDEVMKCLSKLRESPRLSLDSQAIVDSKGSLYPRRIRISTTHNAADQEDKDKQRDSPGLVARLMGLETLPETTREELKGPKLRRSCSEPMLGDLKPESYMVDNAKKKSKSKPDRGGIQQAPVSVGIANQSPSNRSRKPAIPPNKTSSCSVVLPQRLDPSRNGNTNKMANSKLANCKDSNVKTLTVHRKSSHPPRSSSVTNNRRTSTEIRLSSSAPRSHKLQKLEAKDYKEVKNLLARCDVLVNDIEGITTTQTQLSPVSVLDLSLTRRVDLEGRPSKTIMPPDFVYVTKIIQASNSVSEELDLFSLLEKQCYKSGTSNVSRIHRRLVFDTVAELLNKRKGLEMWSWRAVFARHEPSFRQIWVEFLRLQEQPLGEDVFEFICRVLGKDLANETIDGWRDSSVETGNVVLEIERMIFKDLVGEMIQDLAASRRNQRLVNYEVAYR